MEGTVVDWVDYCAIMLALGLLVYSSYRCAIKIGDIQTRIENNRILQDAQTLEAAERIESRGQVTSSSHGPALYTISTVVMTTNDSNSSRNVQGNDELPPPYDEAIFYPISKAMANAKQQ